MLNQLKEAPLIWKLVAYVGIPLATLFACGTVGLSLYIVMAGPTSNRPSAAGQVGVAEVPPPAPATPEMGAETSPSTVAAPGEAVVESSPSDTPVATETLPPTATATPTLVPTPAGYALDWKLEEGQSIAYQTAMEVLSNETKVDYDRIFSFARRPGEEGTTLPLEQMFEEMQNAQPAYSMVSILEKKAGGNINISLVLDDVEFPEQMSDNPMAEGFGQMLSGMKGSVQLQGEITPEGEIASPFMAPQQKNLLALFFELPVGPVAIGDNWEIDLACITLNSAQFTIENSDRVNQVTLAEISETATGEPVAVLNYLIAESVEGTQTLPFSNQGPVPVSMKCSFIGQGRFLIEQGRWEQFSVDYTVQMTGVITSDVSQRLALSPLEQVPVYPEAGQPQAPAGAPAAPPVAGSEEDAPVIGQCRFVSEEMVGPNERVVMRSESYLDNNPSDPQPLPFGSMAILQLANVEAPETLEIHGKTFVRTPTGEPFQTTLDPNPNRPPLPVVDLTLMSSEKDIEEPITLNLGGKAYPLKLDYVMDETIRSLTGSEEYCSYLSPEESKIAIDAMNSH